MTKIHAELHPSVQDRLEQAPYANRVDNDSNCAAQKPLTLHELRQTILVHRKETSSPLITAFNDIKLIFPDKCEDKTVKLVRNL